MNNKVISTIQMAIRAQKIVYGETLILNIRQQKVFVVVLAKDAGIASAKKIQDKCKTNSIKCIVEFSKEDLKEITKKEISALGIKDRNLAKKLIDNMNEGSVFYEKENKTEQ